MTGDNLDLHVPEPEVRALAGAAVARLRGRLRQTAPRLAGDIEAWLGLLAKSSDHPEHYFTRTIGFPLLFLPWWMERTFHAEPAPALQAELAYASVCGYAFIRLVDNVMDGHATVERRLLPAAAVFHAEFHGAYTRFFGPDHPFWDAFAQRWHGTAELTVEDAGLAEVTLEDFERCSGRKVAAAAIPLIAIALHHERPEAVVPWCAFVDDYGRFHQMWNDVFDWSKDLRLGTATYFGSEGARRKQADESVASWVVREGFEWGVSALEARLARLRDQAEALGSPGLSAYLLAREQHLAADRQRLTPGLRQLQALGEAWKN